LQEQRPIVFFLLIAFIFGNRGTIVSTMTRLGTGLYGVRVQVGARAFSLLRNLQTVSEVQPSSYSKRRPTGVLSRR